MTRDTSSDISHAWVDQRSCSRKKNKHIIYFYIMDLLGYEALEDFDHHLNPLHHRHLLQARSVHFEAVDFLNEVANAT
jgi:hypothetical protein